MKNLYLSLLVALICQSSIAQKMSYYHGRSIPVETQENTTADYNQYNEEAAMRSSGQSGTGANINVVYHRAEWYINPMNAKAIAGKVTTFFKTTVANVQTITFDLNKASFDNASLTASYKGSPCTIVFGAGNIITVTLPSALGAINTFDSLSISYAGVPPPVVGAAEGYQAGTSAAGDPYIYSLSESYEDRDWWPCKADMQDKIDSMKIIITAPWTGVDTFWAATNGKLVDSTINGDGTRSFTYNSTYPMASYLVSVSVAKYNRYYRTVMVGTQPCQVVFFIFKGNSNTANILTAMDRTTQVMLAFGAKFGDYPYARDKHGFNEGLSGAGGMEHQTCSAIATNAMADHATLAHELMHQWFGDKATFATWADLWLAEGFARYGEALAGELVPSTGLSPTSERLAAKNGARTYTTNTTKITSFSTSAQVWGAQNTKAVYDRGCMVVSMLRTLTGDAVFFPALKNYLDSTNGSGYRSATTDSLRLNFQRLLSNYNLLPFFNDWVTGKGHPTTAINWNNPSGNILNVAVQNQTRTASSTVTYFHNVIPLRVQGAGAGQDTILVIYDIDGNNLAKAGNGISPNIPGNFLSYTLPWKPTTVTFDPYNMSMSNGTITKTSLVDLKIMDFSVTKNKSYNEALLTLDENSINSTVELERSADGISFNVLGNMAYQPAANGTGKKYSFKDMSPLKANNYYRAKFKNTVAEYVYSKTILLSGAKDAMFSVIENPVRGNVRIKTDEQISNKEYQFNVYDATGKLVSIEQKKVNGNLVQLDTHRFPAGSYVLTVISGGQPVQTLQFVVQN